MKRIHAVVSGRVQGVYYRASTETEARRLGLTGWVRNLANGDVELEAEGSPDAVDALIQWAYQGPPLAKVSHIKVNTVEISHQNSQENTSFSVRY